MSFYTGRTGRLQYRANGVSGGAITNVAKIRDWSIETTVELLSTNTIDTKANTFTPGVMGATGSATIMYYKEGGSSGPNVEYFFDKVMKTSEGVEESDRVYLELMIDSNNADRIGFHAYITSASISVSTGELVSGTINFTMDGTFNNAID
jgi:hypothetical protein